MSWQNLLRGLVILLFYGFSSWRIAKSNSGNRVIECGSLALFCMAVLLVLAKVPNIPDWMPGAVGLLLLLLCLATMGFLVQQGCRAIKRRFWK
jgi:hypothetical protein